MNTPWYDRGWLVILLVILVFPVGFYALYKSSAFERNTKFGIAGVWAFFVFMGYYGDADQKRVDLEVAETARQDSLQRIAEAEAAIADSIAEIRLDSFFTALDDDRRFKVNKDEFKSTAFYKPRNQPRYRSNHWFGVYFGRSDDYLYPRLLMQYSASDWLFIDKVQVLAKYDDAENQVFDIARGNFERDNGSGRIWEWGDLSVEDGDFALLYWPMLVQAKSITVRYTGDKYYKERTLTSNERKALADGYDIYSTYKSLASKAK